MSRPQAATQVRFVKLPVGVPDADTWRFTREHILEGIECFPDAVKMIFAGQNDGKLLIRF